MLVLFLIMYQGFFFFFIYLFCILTKPYTLMFLQFSCLQTFCEEKLCLKEMRLTVGLTLKQLQAGVDIRQGKISLYSSVVRLFVF